MVQWSVIWATTALLLAKRCSANQGYLAHYASGEGEGSKPPPQPFETNTMPSQLATLPINHPLHPEPEVASTETIRTYWPQKVKFYGHHHVRPMNKVHKLKPSSIPFYSAEDMTQAIFMEGPEHPHGTFYIPLRKTKTKKIKDPPLEPTANPSVANPFTLSPETTTTTHILDSTLIDLTNENQSVYTSAPAFKDAASVPSNQKVPFDYLVPPEEGAYSEFPIYNVDITRKPFKINSYGGKPKSAKGPNKVRFKGSKRSNIFSSESQRNQVFKAPPFGPMMSKLPVPYKPVQPSNSGFFRYLFSTPAMSPTTPFPLRSPFFGDNEIQPARFKPHQIRKKNPFPPPNVGTPSFFDADYNMIRPTLSTVIVRENGWVPIANPNPQNLRHYTAAPSILNFRQSMQPFTQLQSTPNVGYTSPRPVFHVQSSPTTHTSALPTTTSLPSTTLSTKNNHQTAASSETATSSQEQQQQQQQQQQQEQQQQHRQQQEQQQQQQQEQQQQQKQQLQQLQRLQQQQQFHDLRQRFQYQQQPKTITNVEVVPSIESPPIIIKNPVSNFNAEYFLQQALTQVRHQQQEKDTHAARNQAPTRRAFVADEEVIYQNPVHGVYKDPYVTIHYPIESTFFQNTEEERSGTTEEAGTTPSYYDFHLNNIPTTLPSQPKEVKKFHYMYSSVKPRVVYEKDRSVIEKIQSKKRKESRAERKLRDPYLVYAEPTAPMLDELLATSMVTQKTLSGARLGQSSGERRSSTEAQTENQTVKSEMEIVKSQGGLHHEEVEHYHSPVRSDAQFL